MVEPLEEAVSLWEHYILQCLHPDRKVAAKHAQRIANSPESDLPRLFQHCTREEAQPFLTPLLRRPVAGGRGPGAIYPGRRSLPGAPGLAAGRGSAPHRAALGRMLQAGQDSWPWPLCAV